MKKTSRLIPALLAFTLLLAGCGSAVPAPSQTPRPAEPSPSREVRPALAARELVYAMLAACPEDGGGAELILSGELPSLLEGYYGLAGDDWQDAAILQAGGASAFELTVVRLSAWVDADAVRQNFQDYLTARQGDFTGYAPDQAALAAKGMVMVHDRYVALAITGDPEGAFAAFSSAFDGGSADGWGGSSTDIPDVPDPAGDRCPFTVPGKDDMTIYDTAPILRAWRTGDRSGLSEKDAAILTAAEGVLGEMLTPGMSDYEKEKALYLWLVYHVDYDWAHQDNRKKMDPDSPNPYGGLINRKAICLGFATTFQLLMDMARVECITVVGAAFQSSEDHAWNMVRLNGTWYCVDATWDMGTYNYYIEDGIFRYVDLMDSWEQGEFEPRWSYFNVTSDYMAETDHQWNYSAVPEATAEDAGQP